ncbi:hypothetical protein Fmac_011067 [Flemingia macrophylla]|uniref:Pentatricopeptide repeat-containing protein n=1 Tax=Flemingia macrophylla TaxID=520843 RepID=A0ABD1MLD7_9FABA
MRILMKIKGRGKEYKTHPRPVLLVGRVSEAILYSKEFCMRNVFQTQSLSNVLIYNLCAEKIMNLKPTVETYTNHTVGMFKEDDFDQANRFLNQMISAGRQPNVFAYTTFVHAYFKKGRMHEAENVITKMKEEGIIPDSLTCTSLIDGYGRMKLID